MSLSSACSDSILGWTPRQLFVILLAFLFVGWMRERPWYVSRVAVPASLVIGLIGAYWTVERIIHHARLG